MTTATRIARLPRGLRLPYVEQGDPSGLPVLLLHGVTDSWRSYEPVLPHLPPRLRAFALTQRGHGDADRPATGYRAHDFAADAAAFLDFVGVESALVVGHSMGATNAQRFAIDFPQRTRGLVLAAPFHSFQRNAGVVEFFQSSIAPLRDPIDPAFAREFQASTLAQPIPSAFLELVVQESANVPAHVWRACFEGFLEDSCVAQLGRIQAPTLVLWGKLDAYCPRADQDALLAAIRGARLEVYEDAGHALHWEEPVRFAADLARFADSLLV
jgi:non-heme chloroperoxidase